MSETSSTRLATLADEYWQAALRADPIAATSIGDRRFDDRVSDPSPEAIGDHRAASRRGASRPRRSTPPRLAMSTG